MAINGVVTAKLQQLDQVLRELRSLGPLTVERLEQDWLVRRAVERDLQIAVEVLIDVCQRVLSIHGSPPAATARAALVACEQLGMLQKAEKYRPLVGFRNILVHDYDDLRLEVVTEIVNTHLGVLADFRDEVLVFVSR
ncbi:MAG: DUF86 domain-containing protein [Candidatus Eremiobacteraeota bacterium]|nr:DUF86 domain-containing protein [Candidatus Eremiobacteraeota bacterium]MCW5870266.1 DUF86 domain-containing protein [Candidatus Eremiobacteraeota bacterium]